MAKRFSGITLGLDIGSNSVGSAWIDTHSQSITLGNSVFPAGVEDSDEKRGAPKNQARRSFRSQRRGIRRRAQMKYHLRSFLGKHRLMPIDVEEIKSWIEMNPWELRYKGLREELTTYQFGRILLHLCQRRGAFGVNVESDYKDIIAPSGGFIKAVFLEIGQNVENKQPLFLISKEDQTVSGEQIKQARSGKTPHGMKLIRASGFSKRKGNISSIEVLEGDYVETEQLLCEAKFDKSDSDEGKIKNAINKTWAEIERQNAQSFGEMMFKLQQERCILVGDKDNQKKVYNPIRNRKNALGETVYEFCADRQMILDEFTKLWTKQTEFDNDLAEILKNSQLRKALFDNTGDKTWRQKGLIFGQRNFYWNLGTLGRCDLEPTDQMCPKPDMYAQEFLVLETLNNIRIIPPGKESRPLDDHERLKVLELLQARKNVTATGVRRALGLHQGVNKTLYTLSLDADLNRKLNTNWFYREIVSGIFGESVWQNMSEKEKNSVNNALLKFDPESDRHAEKLLEGCQKWWGLSTEQAEKLIRVWKNRPEKDERVNLSRKAIKNLLKYLRNDRCSVTEARQFFAEDAKNGASDEQRQRYSLQSRKSTKAQRHFLKKHPYLLPPASQTLSNPVVRKAIHEVRRHIQAYLRQFGRKPDRVVVELAREAKQTAKVRNERLAKNRKRESERNSIVEKYSLNNLTKNQRETAIKRVLLCREQKFVSAYSEKAISESLAAEGTELEIDHIVPKSKGGPNAMVNRVLCFKDENLSKGDKTIKEWLTEEQFEKLEQRFRHLKENNHEKWEYLHKEIKDLDAFSNSQLTDTAYAALQVSEWLRSALYDSEADGKQRVFCTKGSYTALLRRDWQLFPDKEDGKPETEKKRSDHRHHALDAVAIAMSGPECLQRLSDAFKQIELAKENSPSGYQPKREPLTPPWGTAESFRRDVIEKYNNLIVAHRPVNRKIVGEFHKANQLGVVIERDKNKCKNISDRFCTKRLFVVNLTPNHLRVPKKWDEYRQEMEDCLSCTKKRAIRSKMLKFEDVKPGKSGVVRDRWFREELRECLRDSKLNPDKFTDKEIKELIKTKGIHLRSGVPVRCVTLLMADTKIPIARRQWNSETRKMEADSNLKSVRLYQPQSNHHIEIRENSKGKWIGEVVRTFDAARKNALRLKEINKIPKNHPDVKAERKRVNINYSVVNQKDTDGRNFIMSLSIGEMLRMQHPKTKKAGYFVVYQINNNGTVELTPHCDAGRSKQIENYPAREEIPRSAVQLQDCGACKVWVGPLEDDHKILTRD